MSVFGFEPFKSYFSLFKLVSLRCMPLCLYLKDSPYISNACCLLEPSIDRIWPKKTLLFTQFIRGGIQIQVVKLWQSECQPISLLRYLKKINATSPQICQLYMKKKAHSLHLLSLWLFVYIHQLSNARGCPFLKIWFNGSIRTSLNGNVSRITQSEHLFLSIIVWLPHTWGSPSM